MISYCHGWWPGNIYNHIYIITYIYICILYWWVHKWRTPKNIEQRQCQYRNEVWNQLVFVASHVWDFAGQFTPHGRGTCDEYRLHGDSLWQFHGRSLGCECNGRENLQWHPVGLSLTWNWGCNLTSFLPFTGWTWKRTINSPFAWGNSSTMGHICFCCLFMGRSVADAADLISGHFMFILRYTWSKLEQINKHLWLTQMTYMCEFSPIFFSIGYTAFLDTPTFGRKRSIHNFRRRDVSLYRVFHIPLTRQFLDGLDALIPSDAERITEMEHQSCLWASKPQEWIRYPTW